MGSLCKNRDWNITLFLIHHNNNISDDDDDDEKKKVWKIGIFGSEEVHKNLIAQISAACQFENAQLYLRKRVQVPYIYQNCRASIIETGELKHDAFMAVLGSMDITMYVSLTEAFPMTVVESISLGIPAIISPTSAVFDLDYEVRRSLTVEKLDCLDCIADKLRFVMTNYPRLSRLVLDYVPRINQRARELWHRFITDDEQQQSVVISDDSGLV